MTIQDSGGVPVADTLPFTIIALIPYEAEDGPGNGQLSILNSDTVASMYFKWIPLSNTNQNFQIAEAGIVLTAGRAYSWDRLKPGTMLIGRSSVANAVCARDLILGLKEPTQPVGRRF